ncbi:MAG: hypothetical protein AAFX93_03485 [Verrucomicrobiota bacterium]
MLFRLLAPLVGLFAFLMSGCGSSEESVDKQANQPMDTQPADNKVSRVAFLPSRDLSYLPEHSEFLYGELDRQLMTWMKENGVAVTSASVVSSIILANNSALLRSLKSPKTGEMESAVAEIMSEIREEEPVDFFIIPQAMVQSVFLDPPYASAELMGVDRDFVTFGEAVGSTPLQLDTAVLLVVVCNERGNPVYFGKSGIDFLENGVRAGDHVYTSPKQPGQISEDDIDEAIYLAFKEWLEAIRPTRAPPMGSNIRPI